MIWIFLSVGFLYLSESLMQEFGARVSQLMAYESPKWVHENVDVNVIPKCKLVLGRIPTPIHKFEIPGLEGSGFDCWIKRDDLSSFDLSGNKVRKLEFLLAKALSNEHDCVITPGGLQSNHARATAVAARQIGLDSYLILRKAQNKQGGEDEIGLTGNLLLDRMVGANIVKVHPSIYGRYGSTPLCEHLAEQLKEEGRNPFVIPVGGSNTLGSFGYMECIRELIDQCKTLKDENGGAVDHFDHIVFACGSGGTAAGISLGIRLSGLKTQVHAVGVCDTPEYFYNHIREVAEELNVSEDKFGRVESWCHLYQGQGVGYARSTPEELAYLIKVSTSTGIILDPVYSGKALYQFVHHVLTDPKSAGLFRRGDRILFVHTGGVFGLYDKEAEILPLLPAGKVTRLRLDS